MDHKAIRLIIVTIAVTVTACGGTSPVEPSRSATATSQPSGSLLASSAEPGPSATPLSPLPGDTRLVGSYAMTLELPRSCSIPEEQRIRRYAASIAPAPTGDLVVTLGSATFLEGTICTAHAAGLGCNQFFASASGDTAHFRLENNNDDAHGAHIVERVSSGEWVEVIGSASGSMTTDVLRATGPVSVWHCPSSQDYPFPCFGSRGCTGDMTLTLTRR